MTASGRTINARSDPPVPPLALDADRPLDGDDNLGSRDARGAERSLRFVRVRRSRRPRDTSVACRSSGTAPLRPPESVYSTTLAATFNNFDLSVQSRTPVHSLLSNHTTVMTAALRLGDVLQVGFGDSVAVELPTQSEEGAVPFPSPRACSQTPSTARLRGTR